MMRSWRCWAWLLVLLSCACFALTGCIFGGQTGQDSSKSEGRAPGCDEILSVPDDDVGNIGFSANQAAVQLQGPFSGELDWFETDRDARMTVSLQYAGNSAQVVRERCAATRLRLDVIARISSDDGLLDETAIATLDVSSLDRAQLTADIAIGSLHGTYDDAKPAQGELHIRLQLQSGQLIGVLSVFDHGDAGELQTTVGNVTP